MNWKENWKDITILVVLATMFFSVLLQAVTAPKSADITGATWECLQCFGPGNDSGWCKITPDYACNWNCTHDNITTYLYKSKCDKAILVKYMGG